MGKRGPRPTPKAILEDRGSWRAGLAEDSPDPDVTIPECPSWLSEEATKEWFRITPLLKSGGLLTEWDRAALVCYCVAWGDFVQACQKFKRGGQKYVVKGARGGKGCNPLLGIKNKAWERVLKAATEFGLSPSSRTKVKTGRQSERKGGKGRFFGKAG